MVLLDKLLFILAMVTGNAFSQKILKLNLKVLLYLMGIGSGGTVNQSGEKSIVKKLQYLNKPPYTIFDVGANQGQFLKLILIHMPINEKYHVHCFEPSKYTFEKLMKLIDNNNNVSANNYALGASQGVLTLHYPFDGTGYASLTKRRMEHLGLAFNKNEQVSVTTLDHYCIEKNIDRIHLLKMDVEGHELDVLRGASRMFGARKIDMVSFELGAANIDTKYLFKDYFAFFKENNMTVFRITPSGYFSEIRKYDEIEEQFRDTNFVALKNDLVMGQ